MTMTMFSLQDGPVAGGMKDGTVTLEKDGGDALVQGTQAVPTGDPSQGGKTGKVVEIQLKGPMSHAYTEILMLLLGKKEGSPDGMRMETVQQLLYLNEIENAPDEHDKSIVYVFDGKTMDLGDVADLGDAIVGAGATEDKSRVYGVIENAEAFVDKHPGNQMLDQVLRMAHNAGTNIYFSREAWFKSIGL